MQTLLSGIRIIEVSSVVLGPYAGQILADLGAEVIKVEPPEGDIARDTHPQGANGGALFVNNNRNKRMLSLDLKHPQGRSVLSRLIASSDVLFHNMRCDAAERLGLGFEAVTAINPNVVHCSAIGFGQNGPYRDRPAFDDIIQAASGLAGLAMHNGGAPQFVPTIIADKVAALHVVYAILAALTARERGQSGPFQVEVPMFEAMTAFLMDEHLAGATFAQDGQVGYPRVLSVNRRPFRTSDGWIAVLPYTTDQWRRFLAEIAREDIAREAWFQDPRARQSRVDELYALLADTLIDRPTDVWLASLSARDIPCSAIATPAELLDDVHLRKIGFFDVPDTYPPGIVRMVPQPVGFAGRERISDSAPRTIGADSIAILKECGVEESEIAELIDAGVVVQARN